eukprot:NODE_2361_length_565_cov_264.187984_g1872_i0.p1 GENE.NODE_2361_length_565_cov_264.187984_g1872_i0~~NODE_2361_length_565_cov_264.187984_g1872_i0.p1  ORF type:complete len:172 (+),score=34.27 NODE_2361_length_565_cov_264.187984_g1872_i0:59-517(+)
MPRDLKNWQAVKKLKGQKARKTEEEQGPPLKKPQKRSDVVCCQCRKFGHRTAHCKRRELLNTCPLCWSKEHRFEGCPKKGDAVTFKLCTHCGRVGRNKQDCDCKDKGKKEARELGQELLSKQKKHEKREKRKAEKQEAEGAPNAKKRKVASN